MAGLLKPESCSQCNSVNLHREYHPERWVCHNGHITISRQPKLESGVCRECGVRKDDGVPFDNHSNICKKCKSNYNRNYNVENKDAINKHHREYYQENRDRIRTRSNAYWQSTPERFLSDVYNRTRKAARHRIDGAERGLDFTLTREDLTDLYDKQHGLCAITGLPMHHRWGSLYSISIDRIDSGGHYVIGNVQLVCKGVNLFKSTHANVEALEFFSNFFKTHFISEFCVRAKCLICQGCGTIESCHIQKDCPYCDGKGQQTVLNHSAFDAWLDNNGVRRVVAETRVREPQLVEFGGQDRP